MSETFVLFLTVFLNASYDSPTADIYSCVHMMLLSGAVVESAHWPLTVDVVAMVKVACSRHPYTPVAM